MTNAELATELKRLNRLNRAELAALGDRHRRACPNPVHLASAVAKLSDPDDSKYPRRVRAKPGPLPGQTPRAYRTS